MTTPITAHRRGFDDRPASTRPNCWFVVLADRDPVLMPAGVRRVLRHASGRPWIVGDWPDDALVSAVTNRCRIALVGCAAATPSQLLRLLLAARDVHSLDVARAVPGDYHLIAEINGQCRIQGSPTGTRRIFTAVSAGQCLVADRADVLAGLAGGSLNRTALALSLLDPYPPHPLDNLVLWESVEAVPPDHYLFLDRDGRTELMRWWRQPAPVRSRSEGAPILRAALAEAVAVRVAAGRTVSADLTGRLDSISVCCLAARGPADIVAVTGIGGDPAEDDPHWATRMAASLPTVTREDLPAGGLPPFFDGIAAAAELVDHPFVGIVDGAKLHAGLDRVALYGPRLHLTGFGGEQVAGGTPNFLPRLVRRRPWTASRQLRGYCAREGWPWAASLRMMRHRDYADYLGDLARSLDRRRHDGGWGDEPPSRPTALDWMAPPIVPAWLSRAAVELVAEAIADAARRAAPLASTRDGHADLFTIRAAAGACRLLDQIAGAVGPPLSAPFLDDRVVRAALAVRPEERSSPWAHRPLLEEAMRQVVPVNCQRRESRVDIGAERARRLRAHRGALAKACEGSPLADLGLIEPAALREACRRGAMVDRAPETLLPTFVADTWLRSVTGHHG